MTTLPAVHRANEKISERPLTREIPVELESAYLAPSPESVSSKLVTSIEVTTTPQAWEPDADQWRDLDWQDLLLYADGGPQVDRRRRRRAADPFPHPARRVSHARAVHAWCIRRGMFLLGDFQAAGRLADFPAVEVLASFLFGECFDRGRAYFIRTLPKRRVTLRGATWEEVRRLSWDAAEWLIENYDPAVLIRAEILGRRGGKASKPPTRWKSLDLDRLAQLDLIDGMTATRKAQELGVSRSTYYRMRDALAARSRFEN